MNQKTLNIEFCRALARESTRQCDYHRRRGEEAIAREYKRLGEIAANAWTTRRGLEFHLLTLVPIQDPNPIKDGEL